MFQRIESPPDGGLTRARVLIATDDHGLRSHLVSLAQSLGYEVVTAHTAGGLLASAQAEPPDVAVLDHTLPDMSGAELCRQLQGIPQIGPGTPILVTLPPDAEPGARRDALRAGAWTVLARPIDSNEFRSRLQTYMDARLHQQRAGSEGLVDPATGLYNPPRPCATRVAQGITLPIDVTAPAAEITRPLTPFSVVAAVRALRSATVASELRIAVTFPPATAGSSTARSESTGDMRIPPVV